MAGFRCVNHVRHVFTEPAAVTSAHILAESHLVAHTWPQHDLLLLDFFACSTADRLNAFLDLAERLFGGELITVSRERMTI